MCFPHTKIFLQRKKRITVFVIFERSYGTITFYAKLYIYKLLHTKSFVYTMIFNQTLSSGRKPISHP